MANILKFSLNALIQILSLLIVWYKYTDTHITIQSSQANTI